jgi:hypothetical protein
MPSDETRALEAQLLKDSPLKEIDRDSLQELFRRINDHLVLGLPGEIPNSDLDEMINVYIARRHTFDAEQDRKAAEGPKHRTPKDKIDLTILDDL